jgi:hypothetical protein
LDGSSYTTDVVGFSSQTNDWRFTLTLAEDAVVAGDVVVNATQVSGHPLFSFYFHTGFMATDQDRGSHLYHIPCSQMECCDDAEGLMELSEAYAQLLYDYADDVASVATGDAVALSSSAPAGHGTLSVEAIIAAHGGLNEQAVLAVQLLTERPPTEGLAGFSV